jgi:hypothetical protein
VGKEGKGANKRKTWVLLAGSACSRVQMRDTRKFVEERLKSLAVLMNKEPRVAREAMAKHVRKIKLTSDGAHYVATGTWHLLGFSQRRITWCRGPELHRSRLRIFLTNTGMTDAAFCDSTSGPKLSHTANQGGGTQLASQA